MDCPPKDLGANESVHSYNREKNSDFEYAQHEPITRVGSTKA